MTVEAVTIYLFNMSASVEALRPETQLSVGSWSTSASQEGEVARSNGVLKVIDDESVSYTPRDGEEVIFRGDEINENHFHFAPAPTVNISGQIRHVSTEKYPPKYGEVLRSQLVVKPQYK